MCCPYSAGISCRVGDVAVNIKISAPIKSHFAQSRGLDYEQLMGMGSYKEQFRQEMVEWSERVRNSNHGYFCKAALSMNNGKLTILNQSPNKKVKFGPENIKCVQ